MNATKLPATISWNFRAFGILVLVLMMACQHQQETNASLPEESVQKTVSRLVGGPFETGEFFQYGMPDHIAATDTSPGWDQPGPKLLIQGTIYQEDGKTPAPGIILYYYHTDIHGVYASREGLDPRVARHGNIRGWVRSDDVGRYAIYTVKPAPYPNADLPAHIHPSIKEPNIQNAYYINSFVFDDDPLLTAEKRAELDNRGGSGILNCIQRGDLLVANRDIILGRNIPNYPTSAQD